MVGDELKRGISLGQRKRVSIAMEVVKQPRLLLLDEPTSGLDASTSLELARMLRRISAAGVTIATTIHQPRASVFECLDDVILLAPASHVRRPAREGGARFGRSDLERRRAFRSVVGWRRGGA